MSKKAIIIDNGKRVFRTLEDASREMGISPGEVSSAIADRGEVCGRRAVWGYRVYALRLLDGRWVVGMEQARRSGYSLVGEDGAFVSGRAVAERREVTSCWYLNREEE